MKASIQIVNAIANDEVAKANEAFASAIKEKVNTIFDIKKIELTSRIFDKATGK